MFLLFIDNILSVAKVIKINWMPKIILLLFQVLSLLFNDTNRYAALHVALPAIGSPTNHWHGTATISFS